MAGEPANIRTFIAPLRGSGRIAPTLIEDLTLYDPHLTQPPGRHLLQDPPLLFGNTTYLYQVLPLHACPHAFYLQPRQTNVPAIDERPDKTSVYNVAVLCRLCRTHVSLKVDYATRAKTLPCPNQARPVHHLIHSEYNQRLAQRKLEPEGFRGEVFVYECSSTTCSALVTVKLTPAVLDEEEIDILTNKEKLAQRTMAAFEANRGDTEGMKHPTPADVLIDLRAYIRNAWSKDARTEISASNKRFTVRFGPKGKACEKVLENLGFVLKDDTTWQVPQPTPNDTKPLQESHNIFLDNLESELTALISNRLSEEGQPSQDSTLSEDANLQLSRALGCQAYDRVSTSRTARHIPANRPSPFIVLGVPEDSSDELIESAYNWQCASDLKYSPTYLSALRDIASHRNSEMLQMRLAIEVSNGRVDHRQLSEAHRALGLQMGVSDEKHIIGTFNARLSDSPSQEAALREHLRIIGVGTNSRKLLDYALSEISTYEQALEFFDAHENTTDEWLQSFYSMKITDNSNLKELAAKALKIIAMHRRSDYLRTVLETGSAPKILKDMDVGEAYDALGIQDRTIDDGTIQLIYDARNEDDPGRTEYFTQALKAIATDRQSTLLLQELHMAVPEEPKPKTDEPVGLDNIGNTCYLNSLLQFFFTIRELRNIVLHFEQYKMQPTVESMAAKKVGQRAVSVAEVETAQKFVKNLAMLFQSMITSASRAVKPTQELARLTLETQVVKVKIDEIRRRSTLASGSRPNLGSIDSRAIQGPLPPATLIDGLSEESVLISPTVPDNKEDERWVEFGFHRGQQNVDVEAEDNSSEATLVHSGRSSVEPMDLSAAAIQQQQAILDNKENLSPVKIGEPEHFEVPNVQPLRPASPSKINAQAGALIKNAEHNQYSTEEEKPIIYQPPPGPPPIPPRKPVESTQSKIEEYARQQDITEVLGHCLFQLSCAMRPTGMERSGEQRDEIHDLFYGEQRTYTLAEKALVETTVFSSIITRIFKQPRDVYEALDNYFDMSEADNGRQVFVSIAKLPPVITVSLDRTAWDKDTQRATKVTHHVEILDQIHMDRYLEADEHSELMARRMHSWELKEKIGQLVLQKSLLEQKHAGTEDVASLFDDARSVVEFLNDAVAQDDEYGGPIPIDPSLPARLGSLAARTRSRLDDLNAELEISRQQLTTTFGNLEQHPYILHAVFFHSGTAAGGHYWVFIRDHKNGVWRKYNDDHVTIVTDTREIFEKPGPNTSWSATPYVLVYIKGGAGSDSVEELAESVKREVPLEVGDQAEASHLHPLGAGDDGDLTGPAISGPSQMTEMPPTESFDTHMDVSWTDSGDGVLVNSIEKKGDWDDSRNDTANPEVWYKERQN